MTDHRATDQPRFSLRQLLTLTTALAVYFAVLGWAIRNCHPERAAQVTRNVVLFTVAFSLAALIRWRIQVVKRKSAGRIYGSLKVVTPLYTEVRKSLPVFVFLAAIIVLGADRAHVADWLVLMLPLLGIAVTINSLTMRISTVTDRGILSQQQLTSWGEVTCRRDRHEMAVSPTPKRPSRWHSPYRYAVPTELQPVVERLINEAQAADREGEAPAEPMRVASAGSAGASSSRDA
ncbi:MAG: hypothetical protein CMJ58_21255 [Planctomycetaceae bacterium]|nr:hypothetical protein [Planctomycetaceae bacterium]